MNVNVNMTTGPAPTTLLLFDPSLLDTNTFTLLIVLPTVLLLLLILQDYHAFLALGPGGTPSTPAGYLRISLLRIFALRNPLQPPSLPSSSSSLPPTGLLHRRGGLAPRRGPRPTVAGIAPHRQTTQKAGPDMYAALTAAITALARRHPDRLYTGTSCFEKHSTGIFWRGGDDDDEESRGGHRRTCNGEVVHGHPSDGSMHLTLHPADVRVVLEAGWGQRHPLAREDWWLGRRSVPAGFVMVYAPRDAEELAVVMEVICAAVWWVSGMELEREGG